MGSEESSEKQNWPRFRVYKVEDGQRWGILLEKQRDPGQAWMCAYFHRDDKRALPPTREIILACGNEHHELSSHYCQHAVLNTDFRRAFWRQPDITSFRRRLTESGGRVSPDRRREGIQEACPTGRL